jgi:hypothetical protein
MWCVVTLVRVSLSMAGEGRTVMAMAAECTARSRRVRRMTGMPRMVSQAPHGHHHEASRTECQAKRIRIHKVTACQNLLRQGGAEGTEEGRRFIPTLQAPDTDGDYPALPAYGMVRGTSCDQAYGLCINAVIWRVTRRGV